MVGCVTASGSGSCGVVGTMLETNEASWLAAAIRVLRRGVVIAAVYSHGDAIFSNQFCNIKIVGNSP